MLSNIDFEMSNLILKHIIIDREAIISRYLKMPTEGYAVVVYPEKSVILPLIDLGLTSIYNYVKTVEKTLAEDKNNYVGSWVNNFRVYFHIVRIYADKDTAITIGKKYHQLAVFDLKNKVDIKC